MITIEEIEKLAALSRIKIKEEEKESLRKDIDAILGYVSDIQKVSATVDSKKKVGSLRNVTREDGPVHQSGIFSEDILKQAPGREGNYVKVKKIL